MGSIPNTVEKKKKNPGTDGPVILATQEAKDQQKCSLKPAGANSS
jgi:hypothetical protein